MRCLAVLLVGAALAASASAQSSVRRDTFALAPGQASARLEARPIPGTEAVAVFRDTAFVPLAAGAYELDGSGLFRLLSDADTVRYVAVTYRAAPVVGPVRATLPSVDSLRALYAPDTTGQRRAPPGPARAPPTIQTRGSITRGVVAGSNRDVSVTSALRLSLQGEVSPGVTLRAALTDEDTPILPEGTTRQLSDLDRVFVEVEGPDVRARLGDVDLSLDRDVVRAARAPGAGRRRRDAPARPGRRLRRARRRLRQRYARTVPQPGRGRPRGRAGAVPAGGRGRRGVRGGRARLGARLPRRPAAGARRGRRLHHRLRDGRGHVHAGPPHHRRAPHHGRLRVHDGRLHAHAAGDGRRPRSGRGPTASRAANSASACSARPTRWARPSTSA